MQWLATVDWYSFFKDFAGPIATVIAAAAAAFVAIRLGKGQRELAEAQAQIAALNWRTANEKVVIELIERRNAIFDELAEVVGEVIRTGKVTGPLTNRYQAALIQVPYFFGPEVEEYFEGILAALSDLSTANAIIENEHHPDRTNLIGKRNTIFRKIADFYKESKPLVSPYIKAHQKVSYGADNNTGPQLA